MRKLMILSFLFVVAFWAAIGYAAYITVHAVSNMGGLQCAVAAIWNKSAKVDGCP